MKQILLAATILMLGAMANAAQSDVCAKFMPCGNFEGTGNWYDVNGKQLSPDDYKEKIVITPIDKMTVNIKVYIYSGDTLPAPWTDSKLVFKDDGQYALVDNKGQAHGTGFCAKKVCTIAFQPVDVTEDKKSFVNSFVDILRFDDGGLKRYNMVADSAVDSELTTQRSTLTLK